MDETKTIEITFNAEESGFFAMVEQHCKNSGITESDYIKELIKRDLGWGRFMKRRKPGADRKN